MELQQSFRAVVTALDTLQPGQTEDFLARLVLILANEINDAEKVALAVKRALVTIEQDKEQ